MNLRNQLLALFCLLVFSVFGWLYVRTWVVQKPFGIILLVSDSMVARHLTAARLYEGGADYRLAIEALPHFALVRNAAHDFAVPDAAAAATALATGRQVNHRALAMDPQGRPLPSILELARAKGRATGLVSNGPLAGPSAAAFYAHHPDARERATIAKMLTARGELQLVLGGGGADFLPAPAGQRADGRDLLAELKRTGRQIVNTRAELEDATAYDDRGLLGVFSSGPLAFTNETTSGTTQPTLADLVRRAIEILQTNRNGYVLVVDAALATIAAERNEGERLIAETVAFDHAVATAQKYAGERALIIAVGKHATGGMSLNGYPLRQDHGVALLGTNTSGHPAIAWTTGPNGPPPPDTSAPAVPKPEPAAFHVPSALNTAEDVLAAGIGDGAEKLHGYLDSTAIFEILRAAL